MEVSPKLSHAEFPNGDIDIDNDDIDIVESVDPLEELRMPSVGPSPSVFSSDALSSRYSSPDKTRGAKTIVGMLQK